MMFCKKLFVVSLIIGLQASNLLVTGAPQSGLKVDPLAIVQRSALKAHNLQFPYKGGVVLDAKTWPCSGLQSFELSVATPLETSQGLFSEEAQSNFIYQLGRSLQAGTELPRLWHGLPSSPTDIISKEDTIKLLKAVSVNFTLASSENCNRIINEPYHLLETTRDLGQKTALIWNTVLKQNLNKVLVLNEDLPSLFNHLHRSQSWSLLESWIRHNDNALLGVVSDLKTQLETYDLPEIVRKVGEVDVADLTSAVGTLTSRAQSSEEKTLALEQRCDSIERELVKIPVKPGEASALSASQFSTLASRVSVLEEASRATETRLLKLEADSDRFSLSSETLTANLETVQTAVARIERAVEVLEKKSVTPPPPSSPSFPPPPSPSSGSSSSSSTSTSALITSLTPLSPVLPPTDRSRRTSRSPETKLGSRILSDSTKTLRGVAHYVTLTGNLVRDINSIGRKLNHLINNVKSVTNKVENEHEKLSFESPFPWVQKLYPNLTKGASVEGKVESLSDRLYAWGVNNPKYLAVASFGVALCLILLVIVLAIVSLTRISKLESALERSRPRYRSDSDLPGLPRRPTTAPRRTRSLEEIASADRRLRDYQLSHLGWGVNNQVWNPTWNYPLQQCAPQPQQPPSYSQSRTETVEEARARGRAELKDTVELVKALSPSHPPAQFPTELRLVHPGFARQAGFGVPRGYDGPVRRLPNSRDHRDQVQHEEEHMQMLAMNPQ